MKDKSKKSSHPLLNEDIERLIKEEVESGCEIKIAQMGIDAGCHPSAPRRVI